MLEKLFLIAFGVILGTIACHIYQAAIAAERMASFLSVLSML